MDRADDVWPKPVQEPRPPIIVGGTAKPRTVRGRRRFADEYNTVCADRRRGARARARLDEAAATAGREPLRFSMMIGCVVGRDEAEVERPARRVPAHHRRATPRRLCRHRREVATQFRAYEAAGVERVMLQHLVHEDVEMVAVLGDVAARLS